MKPPKKLRFADKTTGQSPAHTIASRRAIYSFDDPFGLWQNKRQIGGLVVRLFLSAHRIPDGSLSAAPLNAFCNQAFSMRDFLVCGKIAESNR